MYATQQPGGVLILGSNVEVSNNWGPFSLFSKRQGRKSSSGPKKEHRKVESSPVGFKVFGSPCNEEHSMLGSTLVPPVYGNPHMRSHDHRILYLHT